MKKANRQTLGRKARSKLTVPFHFTPREYQEPLYNAIAEGYKRGVCVWHRRSGKDKTLINIVCKEAFKRIGSYYYFFPTYKQGRKILWDGADRSGFRFLGHIPEEFRVSANSTEMKIELVNGSIIQVVGSDNIDTVVGTNPVGCVFSEFALQDPRGWDFVRPILLENEGWAFFNFTPRGHNHAYELWKIAQREEDWFSQLLTVNDTYHQGARVISDVMIDQERRHGMSEDLIQQEYFCSFEASLIGAYFANEMRLAAEQGRICGVPVEGGVSVNTYWDIGIDDSMSIILEQQVGREIHLVDYYENSGEGLSHYINWLNNWQTRNNVPFGTHVMPHDAAKREIATGKPIAQSARDMGLGPSVQVAKRPITKEDSIEAARQLFSRVYFDERNCERLIDALRSYHKEYDEERKVFGVRPVHDWSSHGADSFQTMALGLKETGTDWTGWRPER